MRTRLHHSLRLTLLLAAPLWLGACSQWNGKDDSLAPRADLSAESPDALYAAGMDALRQERYADAQGLFDTVEREHPYSTWATSATLMSAYSDYQRNRYTEAIGGLNRFIQLHPGHRDIAYAYYLRSLCYYEQIVDSQRDQKGTELALAQLQEVVNRFPDTSYARDASLKMDLARDHLAGQEMEVGRFYQARGLPQAAIGRFRRVVDQYQTTNHVPEALHRLTEIYLSLGLVDEARKTASVLGHNYPGNSWYQDSYALLVEGAAPAQGDRPGFVKRSLNWIF
ncbi:outer membrane protein assembly factor BamD [Roseomonas marmotae]|uniref:Outer membrane protein assembly factor BamD n=1 Tax=Roseomonas marmotae TaxID=2768161 RepID=A0ABS3KBH4_9PROT|nr:outer membrane protein assembly factor BamD [Roseomonas marmotae]MBO1074813.1 outer membrane protein assembly factor BamD [Roseomonas marmotae]QTI80679.1 outer membrane protein assembly factor BamD [Roseomonas marmotae]